MKKIIKYSFFIFIVIISLLLMLPMFTTKDLLRDSNVNKTVDMSDTVLSQISAYYNQYGHYPKSLQDFSIYSNQEFIESKKEHDFQYQSYGNNRSKYIFSWRGGAMNWTGYSCTNDKLESSKKQDGVVKTYGMAGGTICIVKDLH